MNKKFFNTTISILISTCASIAQLTLDKSKTPSEMVNDVLLGDGVSASDIVYSGNIRSKACFNNDVETNLFKNGIFLTTGDVDNYFKENEFGGNPNSDVLGGPNDHDLDKLVSAGTFDATVLQFNFIPLETPIKFSYVFASEEYPEYVCSSFNDVFAFFVTGENPSGPNYVKKNMAIIPGTTNTPVAINTVNGKSGCDGNESHSDLYVDNLNGKHLEFDGLTDELEVSFDVVPGKTYTIKIALADVGDFSYDSGVFLKGGSFSSPVVVNNPIDECHIRPSDVEGPLTWYFGQGPVGLTWESANAQPVISSESIGFPALEATTTVTDQAGDLLFYSNGIKVFDKNHKIMPNGGGLLGSQEVLIDPKNGSSLNGALAVNKPGDQRKYYIFTTPSAFHYDTLRKTNIPGGTTGLRYHIVDLDAVGNGTEIDPLGDVESKNNILLETAAEMLVATGDGCGGIWVVGHDLSGNKFHSFLLTTDGVSKHVVSEVGPTLKKNDDGYTDEARGSGDFNPQGTKVAFTFDKVGGGYLFDFNKKTGELTNSLQLHQEYKPYGIEFSPNGEFIYFSAHNYALLIRYNLINKEVKEFGMKSDHNKGDIETGPDGKMYVGKVWRPSFPHNTIGVISDPNEVDIAKINYKDNGISFGDKNINPGLPQAYFYKRGIAGNGSINASINCIDETSSFQVTNLPSDVVSYSWDMGDGTIINNVTSIDHIYSKTGKYTVTFNATKETACDCDYTLTKEVYIDPCLNCAECVPSYAPTPGEEYTIGAWVKENINGVLNYEDAGITIDFEGAGQIGPIKASGPIIDSWQKIEYSFIIPSDATVINIKLVNEGGNEVYFDDIRVHPFNSNMKSFVYDPLTLRLHAELDENNYATMYEYDEEGDLVRVKKETERGIKTINETRQNLSKQKGL